MALSSFLFPGVPSPPGVQGKSKVSSFSLVCSPADLALPP